jgi:phospholipase A1
VTVGQSPKGGDWTLSLRHWWRIPEGSATTTTRKSRNYIGRGDLQTGPRWGGQKLSVMMRHSLRSGRDTTARCRSTTPSTRPVRGNLQWFYGYFKHDRHNPGPDYTAWAYRCEWY